MSDQTNTPVQPQAAPPAPAQPPSASVNARFQDLLRRTKELEQRESRLKQLEPQVQRLMQLEDALKKKDISGFLRQAGLNYEDVAKTALATTNPNRALEERLAKLETELVQARSEGENYRREQAQEEYKRQIAQFVQQANAYPLIKAAKAEGAILDYILDRYNSTGETISEVDAAAAVEAQLSELANQFITVESIKSKIAGSGSGQVTTPQVKSDPTTLSNSQNDTPARDNWDELSQDESIARLAKQLEYVETPKE